MKKSEFIDILFVEDSPIDAELTLIALREENLANNVIWLQDGAQALDFIFAEGDYAHRNIENHPKLILLDLKMPKVGGIEVVQRIRSDNRTKSIPIVIMTSSKEEKDVVDTYKLGINSYIVKPVDFDKFSKSVKDIGFYWLLMNHSPNVS
jgi:CheY-like chemotaxis protein